MDGHGPMHGAPHHAAGRLAAHAAALEPLHHQTHSPVPHQARISPAPDASSWANDFARFSAQAPQQPQQRHGPPPAVHHAGPQLQQNRMAEAFGFQPNMAAMQPNAGFSPFYGPTNGGFMDANVAAAQRPAAEADFDEEMSRWMAVHGNGAENTRAMEDVDAVMDQMARELELNDRVLQEDEAGKMETTEGQVEPGANAHFTDLGSAEIGNLSSGNEVQPTEQGPDPKARSEVSEAAERLLESVQHEDGEKWKNSVFLSLMRDFRDGRKDIVDNEIRETPDEGGPAVDRAPAN